MSIHRYAARVDDNKLAIVDALRQAGATVNDIRQPVDLLVGYRGHTILMEVKDGAKSPSRRSHTDMQCRFIARWTGGMLVTVLDVQGALAALKAVDNAERSR